MASMSSRISTQVNIIPKKIQSSNHSRGSSQVGSICPKSPLCRHNKIMQLDLQRSDCSGIYDNREHPNDRFALLMSLALYGETQLCAQPVQLVGGGGRVASRTRAEGPGATASAARLFPGPRACTRYTLGSLRTRVRRVDVKRMNRVGEK